MVCGDNSFVSILTLGDGDFTYSLDLARYLSSLPDTEHKSIQLTASGIDSQKDMMDKYRDGSFVIGQLATLSSSRLKISVQHGINAILNARDTEPPEAIGQVDHVMFHHPHLGTEDALLHSRFLCHFFYSCVNGWMKSSSESFVHLTLVAGQCERWKCLEAAGRHGLVLLQRNPFVPPPTDKAFYQYRRHQTGKSFESRTTGSEALIFGREEHPRLMEALSRGLFSWSFIATSHSDGSDQIKPQNIRKPLLSCPHCDREFKEKRSLNCHIRDRHPNGPEKRSKQTHRFDCLQCRTATGDLRSFETEQALDDHRRAKHSALHKEILPDWYRKSHDMKGENEDGSGNAKICICSVCGAVLGDREAEKEHLEDFRPLSSSTESYICDVCGKGFREARAKLQHENFCMEP